MIKRICVYCGSSAGRRPEYAAAASALGQELARRGIGLVYGGASVGLMAVIADAVLAAGGEAIGVIPNALVTKEVAHHGLTELITVTSMHERKARMAELSDGFIALPGGLGTLEELFEMLTWGQLGFHSKPCGLLNTGGFFDGLLAFLDHAAEQQFLRERHRHMLITADHPSQLLDSLLSYEAPAGDKWIGNNEIQTPEQP